MNLGIRGQLLLLTVGLVAISVIIANTYLRAELEELLLERIRADLLVRLELLEREVSAMDASLFDNAEWDRVADDYARRSKTRVTLIRHDGAVIGDSTMTIEDLAALGNHRGRPEIIEALSHGFGSSTRESDTLDGRLLYVAVPFRREDVIQGVARISIPVKETEQAIAQLGRVLILGWIITLGAALFLSGIGAQLGSRRIQQLRHAARGMTEGDLSIRTGVEGKDEIAELGRTLDRLAEGLSSTLHELRSDRELMGAVLGSMREGVLVLDREGKIVLANPSLCALFGLEGEIVGWTVEDAFRLEPSVVAWLDSAKREKKPPLEEISCGQPDPRSYLVHATELAGEGHTLAVFVDVTELRKLESVRREFVANASHELRTPVTIIKSAAEACQAELHRDVNATERFIEIIDRNAERLRRLVDDLLELTRVESAELALNLEPLPIGRLVDGVLQLFREQAERKRIQLGSSLEEQDLLVTADRHATEEVLGNLVENAIKYCSDGSSVKVHAAWEGEDLRIVVEDDGPGIEEEHLPRLFERFYRVDRGRSSEVGGTGLGLAIVKHLVESMRGSVGVESTPGRGSRFWFTLPRISTS